MSSASKKLKESNPIRSDSVPARRSPARTNDSSLARSLAPSLPPSLLSIANKQYRSLWYYTCNCRKGKKRKSNCPATKFIPSSSSSTTTTTTTTDSFVRFLVFSPSLFYVWAADRSILYLLFPPTPQKKKNKKKKKQNPIRFFFFPCLLSSFSVPFLSFE